MNNTFNLQRFGLLLKRQWLEFGKIYLISLLVTFGILVAFYGSMLWPYFGQENVLNSRELNFREPLFLCFGFLFVSVVASSYFAHMGQKPKAIIDLLIPASTFEKFLTGIVFTSILSVGSFILLFYVTDLVFLSKLMTTFKDVTRTTQDGQVVKVLDDVAYFFTKNGKNIFVPVYIVPFFTTAVFLLGSIYFNRFHYIKTAMSVIIFSGIWTAIIAKSGKLLFDDKVEVDPNRSSLMHNNAATAEFWLSLVLILLTLVLWGITYMRLKEKEV